MDVLSVAFPYPELDEEFLEDGESEEDVQVEGDEERILEDEENEKGDDKTRETENQQLQVGKNCRKGIAMKLNGVRTVALALALCRVVLAIRIRMRDLLKEPLDHG